MTDTRLMFTRHPADRLLAITAAVSLICGPAGIVSFANGRGGFVALGLGIFLFFFGVLITASLYDEYSEGE